MAEGQAVMRWKKALQPLIGEPLVDVHLPKRWDEKAPALVGQWLTEVGTHGKILLLTLSGGDTILCHAMQYGSWQIGEVGMALRKEAKYIRLKLVTANHEAIFYHGPIIELLTPLELAINARLNTQGPDVMAADFDRDEAWRRVQEHAATSIGEVVLLQQVMAGIGNIYKSEGLFLAGVHPARLAGTVQRDEMELFWDKVVPLMWEATARYGPTITLPADLQVNGDRHWVYRRQGRPCLVCGTKIKRIVQGELKRSSFFCPVCQPEDPTMLAGSLATATIDNA